jgi:hypothetical protein
MHGDDNEVNKNIYEMMDDQMQRWCRSEGVASYI